MITTACPTRLRQPAADAREERVTLAAALGARKSFTYLYDYGDGWEHRVTVEKILPPDPGLKLPQCLDGANACPPETSADHLDTSSSWRRSAIRRTRSTSPDARTVRWSFRAHRVPARRRQ